MAEDTNRNIPSAVEDSEQTAADGQTTVLIIGIIGFPVIISVASHFRTRTNVTA